MRKGRFNAGLAVCLLAGMLKPALGESARRPVTLDDYLPGYSIARCLFAEGRLVLEHEGEFLVLRQGDTLPGRPRIRLLEIGGSQAVLMEAQVATPATAVAVPNRLIKIAKDPGGGVSVILVSAELPNGLEVEVVEPVSVSAAGEEGATLETSGEDGGSPDGGRP